LDLKEIATYIVIILIGVILAQHMNVVVSGSMEPVMERGDIVIIDTNPGVIENGDIVVYNADWYNQPVIHRVIDIKKTSEGELYLIKGDNNPSPDPSLVKREQIISKVITINNNPLIIPKIGYITIWIRGL